MLLPSTPSPASTRPSQPSATREKLIFGEDYRGDGLIFTHEDDMPLEPSALSRQFKRGLLRAELPDVIFHSLRHSAVSIMLAHGAH